MARRRRRTVRDKFTRSLTTRPVTCCRSCRRRMCSFFFIWSSYPSSFTILLTRKTIRWIEPRFGGFKIILQIHAEDNRLADVRLGIGDDGLPPFKSLGGGMAFQASQNPAQNAALKGLKLRSRRVDTALASTALGDGKLVVNRLDLLQFF